MEQSWLLENSEKVGVIGILAFNVIALLKGWVVTGREYVAAIAERDALRKSLDEANARDRERLSRAEEIAYAFNGRK